MNYRTYKPHKDLDSLVKCYWTLEISGSDKHEKQRIIPDGCIEMAFILGDDIKRFTTDHEYILQPRAMVLGQITDPFVIQPTGYVNTFAIRFYPYGFSNFVSTPIKELAQKETPIGILFGKKSAKDLEETIVQAADTADRINKIEDFLLKNLRKSSTVDQIIKKTIGTLFATNGRTPIYKILKDDVSQRRQIERKFLKYVGISPKQLARVIRFQAALYMLLAESTESLSSIAYESEYYDQAHFVRDFKYFTGTTPKSFFNDKNLALSSLFYKN